MTMRIPSTSWALSALAALPAIAAAQAAAVGPERPPTSLSWGDYDGDGFQDAFVVTSAAQGRLFRNRGDGTLEDVTASAGLSALSVARFAAWEDVDRDGDLELFVGTHAGPSLLFVNERGTFQDVGRTSGTALGEAALEASFVDYDRDGLPDLQVRTSAGDLLFRNLGSASFERVELGLEQTPRGEGADAGPAPVRTDAASGSPRPEAPQSPTSGGAAEPQPEARLARPEDPPTYAGRREAPANDVLAAVGVEEATAFPACALALEDQDGSGCLRANSTPTAGQLYPIGPNLFVDAATGRVGMNDVTPSTRLDVSDTSTLLSVVRADGPSGPTRGYLGVQGASDFDGVASADWSSLEIGVAGISTGVSTSDNYGVRGHSNGVGVRGEWSGNPTGTFGELGTADGVGVHARGLILAGDFEGSVDVTGTLRLRDAIHDHVVIDPNLGGNLTLTDLGDVATVVLGANGIPSGGAAGSELGLFAPDGNPRITLDTEAAAGGGFLALWNSATRNAIQLFGDNGSQAGRIDLYNRLGGLVANSILLNARDSVGTGSEIQLTTADGANVVTVDLDGLNAGTGQIQVNESDGSVAFRFLASALDLYNASSSTTIHFDRISGTKSAVVDTPSFGQRLVYCMESPEIWFEDFGGGALADGSAVVELDPMFLETVTIDAANPMRVYITLTGESRGVYVEKGARGFIVRELDGGLGSATFDWRVVAKRKGLESRRLDPYVDARQELGTSADAEPSPAAAAPSEPVPGG
jgi:hypothetical protein